MKDKIVVLAVLVAIHAGIGSTFSVDWAAFQATGDTNRVEFFYAIPYNLLKYEKATEAGQVARFSVRFQLLGPDGTVEDATIYKQARISTFVEAEKAQRVFVDGFGVPVPAGRYLLRVTISSLTGMQTGDTVTAAGSVYEDSIEVPDFRVEPALSTIQLAAGIVHDTVSGGFSVVPNPTRRYGGDGVDRVYFYFEGYGLSPAADSYDVVTSILDRTAEPETLITSVQAKYKGQGTRVSAALGVSVDGLAAGQYALAVAVADRGNGSVAARSTWFTIVGEETPADQTPYRLEMTELETRYYDRLGFIATARELAYYNALSDSGREAYLAWYWSRHNLGEFARRMETARGRYRSANRDGLKTDRGRIYVEYGEPDEVERRVLEVDRRPREYWQYYNQGFVFVFIDLTGSDDYRLVYTNCPHEPSTGYERLLTPDEVELFH